MAGKTSASKMPQHQVSIVCAAPEPERPHVLYQVRDVAPDILPGADSWFQIVPTDFSGLILPNFDKTVAKSRLQPVYGQPLKSASRRRSG